MSLKVRNVCILNYCQSLYVDLLKAEYRKDENLSKYEPSRPRYLEVELLKTFKNEISIVSINKNKIIKPYGAAVLSKSDLELLQKNDILQRAALLLREEIKSMEKKKIATHY